MNPGLARFPLGTIYLGIVPKKKQLSVVVKVAGWSFFFLFFFFGNQSGEGPLAPHFPGCNKTLGTEPNRTAGVPCLAWLAPQLDSTSKLREDKKK